MKKLVWMLLVVLTLGGVLGACTGKSAQTEQKDVPVEEILQAIKDAYGEGYLPNAPLDETMLEEMYDIDMELVDTFVAEMPMIGFHPDRVIVAKAVEGKGTELEEEFKDLQ